MNPFTPENTLQRKDSTSSAATTAFMDSNNQLSVSDTATPALKTTSPPTLNSPVNGVPLTNLSGSDHLQSEMVNSKNNPQNDKINSGNSHPHSHRVESTCYPQYRKILSRPKRVSDTPSPNTTKSKEVLMTTSKNETLSAQPSSRSVDESNGPKSEEVTTISTTSTTTVCEPAWTNSNNGVTVPDLQETTGNIPDPRNVPTNATGSKETLYPSEWDRTEAYMHTDLDKQAAELQNQIQDYYHLYDERNKKFQKLNPFLLPAKQPLLASLFPLRGNWRV